MHVVTTTRAGAVVAAHRKGALGLVGDLKVSSSSSSSTSSKEKYAQDPVEPLVSGECDVTTREDCQERRLKLVSSQAFLFVACFFICNAWTTVGAKFESIGTR